jgi:hypothetical protein
MMKEAMVCKVLPSKHHGQLFSVLVNFLLGFFSLSSLLIKRRWFDKRKRSNKVFILDAAKLAIGGTAGHALNIVLAHMLDETGLDDECKFYLVNYMLDFLIGVPLSYFIILASSVVAETRKWVSLERRGYYGRPLDIGVWAKQTLEFTLTLALSKTLLAIPLFVFKDEFEKVGAELVRPVQAHPRFELFLVMIIVPVTLNALQFVIFDQILLDEHMSYESIESIDRNTHEPVEPTAKEGHSFL